MISVRRCLVLAATAALLSGCGSSSDPTTEEEPVDQPSTSSSPSQEPSGPAASGPAASGPAGMAVADLAERLGVDAGDIETVSVEEVTWRNGSRGCAEPGMSYAQALIEGSRITLRADGTTYEYHAGGSQPPALCEKPTE